MRIFTPEQIWEFKEKLNQKGEKTVREELANHIYGESNQRIVESWLEEKENERQENRFQQEFKAREKMFQDQMQKEEERFQKQLEVSKSQADSAKLSARAANISAIIAVIGGVISIASVLYHFFS